MTRQVLWGLCVLVIGGCSARRPLPDPDALRLRPVANQPEAPLDPLVVLSAQVTPVAMVEGGAALDVVLPTTGPCHTVQLLLWEIAPTATSSLTTQDGRRTLRVSDSLTFPALRLKVVVQFERDAEPLVAGPLQADAWLRLAGEAPRAESTTGPVPVALQGTIAVLD